MEQTTDRVLGRTEYNVPIEQGSLSQSKIPTKTAYEVTAATPTTTVLSPLTPIAQPTTVQNTQVEPEIVKQSLPIENTTTKQTENSSTKHRMKMIPVAFLAKNNVNIPHLFQMRNIYKIPKV